MHIYARRLLAIVFITIFFIFTPPLIMITSGYLYNFKKNKFEKTSLLIINSEPTGANILLNNNNPRNWWSLYFPFLNQRTFQTPARINYLTPNDYEISLTLDNFHPWKTIAAITPGTTTFLENIKLWPLKEPSPLTLPPMKLATLAPDGKLLALVQVDGRLSIYDTQTKKMLTTDHQAVNPKNIIWTKNSENIVFSDSENWRYLNLNSKQIKNIPIPSEAKIIDYLENNTILYQDAKNKFYVLENDWQNTIATTINAKIIKDINSYQNEIWIIEDNKLISLLENKIFTTSSEEKLLAILFQDKEKILLLTQKNTTLLFQKKNNSWQTLINNLKIIKILPLKNNRWLWWNEFEIGIFNAANQKNTLLTRLSDHLATILPLLDKLDQHFLIVAKNKLLALDLQLEERPVITEIFQLDSLEEVVLNKDEKTLLFTTKDKNNLFSLWDYLLP